MNKLVMTTLEKRTVALACGSLVMLLSACGGGGQEDGTAPTVTAASVTTSAAASTPAAAGARDETAEPAEALHVDPADYVLAGYPDGAGNAGWFEPFPTDAHAAEEGALSGSNESLDTSSAAPAAPAAPSANAVTGTSLYVSPKGLDSNPGTAAKPLRNIASAARLARPGTTVYVAPGVYAGGFQMTTDGSAGARIAYVSTKRWGAKIVPPKNSRNDTAWDNRGDYVDIVGFEVDGSAHNGGTRWTHGIYSAGSFDTVRRNHVHHIAKSVPCTSAGGSAIGVDSYYRGVKSHVLANLVHDIGPAGCRYVQGIYFSTSGSVKNNVVHRVAEGAIHLWHDARDVIITNNTVARSNTGIIVGGGDFYHASGPNDRTFVYNNIVVDNKMGISEQGQTGRSNSYRNNLVYRNTTYDFSLKNGLTHSNTVNQAPLFVGDIGVAFPNFSLSPASPARGRGTALHAESTDFNGRARNARSGFDIGAYQFY